MGKRHKAERRRGPKREPVRERVVTTRSIWSAVVLAVAISGLAVAILVSRSQLKSIAESRRSEQAARPIQTEKTASATVLNTFASSKVTYAGLKEEASVAIHELATRFPSSSQTLDLLARMHCRFDDTEEATKVWRRCLELNPDQSAPHYGLGRISLERGHDEDAMDHFRRSLDVDPASDTTRLYLGESLLRLGKTDEAIAVLGHSAPGQAPQAERILLLGQAFLKEKRHEEAKQCFLETIQLAPDHAQAHYGLATTYARLGLGEEAKPHFQRFQELKSLEIEAGRQSLLVEDIVGLRPDVARWYLAAGHVYFLHDRPQLAERLWLRAVDLWPDIPEGMVTLINLYRQQGRMAEARAIAERFERQLAVEEE